MNVLSLFDGISCGRVALERAGIKVNKYFASEINTHAIKVSQKNYPDIVRLGDVTKFKEWNLPKTDLLLGGSPCQSFSFNGKQLNFNDTKGKLFFEFIKILRLCKPKYFLFENVPMRKEAEKIISNCFKSHPIKINSSTLSAQNRQRLYWTNIPNIVIPENKDLRVKDILENEFTETLGNYINLKTKKGNLRVDVLEQVYNPENLHKKSCVAEITGDTPSGISRQIDRLYSVFAKSPTLTARGAKDIKIDMGSGDKTKWRTLSPIEAERLQTLPDNYTEGILKNKRYECVGNGWTVDIIAHILKGMEV